MSDEIKFIEAIENGDMASVERMLYMDPSLIEARAESGISALLLSAYLKDRRLIEILMNHVSHLDIHEACALGYLNEVKRCIEEDGKNLERHSSDGFTPLILACYFDNFEIARWLIENGADPDLRANNQSGVSPLNSAVAASSQEIVELLLEAGADPDAAQQSGITPLHSAAHSGDRQICELLIKNGARVMQRSEDGRNAIDFASEKGYEDIVRLLSANID